MADFRAGDWCWIPVTDHPRTPHVTREDTSDYKCASEEEAQTLCDAWNAYGGAYHWYPLRVQVLPGDNRVPPGQLQMVGL